MIQAEAIKEILGVYAKHGWNLRRVLLSDELKNSLGIPVKELFGDVPLKISPLDALWFSRPSKGAIVAWELRHLSSAPYALLEGVEGGSGESALEKTLAETESRMQNALRRKN
jgi:hypothetical protein